MYVYIIFLTLFDQPCLFSFTLKNLLLIRSFTRFRRISSITFGPRWRISISLDRRIFWESMTRDNEKGVWVRSSIVGELDGGSGVHLFPRSSSLTILNEVHNTGKCQLFFQAGSSRKRIFENILFGNQRGERILIYTLRKKHSHNNRGMITTYDSLHVYLLRKSLRRFVFFW